MLIQLTLTSSWNDNWAKNLSPNPLPNDRLARDGNIITVNFSTNDNTPGQSTGINPQRFLVLQCKLLCSKYLLPMNR